MARVIDIGIALIGLVLIQQLTHVSSQVDDDSVCYSKVNCSQCIRAGPQCVWCKTKNKNFNEQWRCGTMDWMTKTCPPQDIVNPQNHIDYEKLSESKFNPNTIDVKSQEMTMKLRTNSPMNLTLNFGQVEDYPVDVYYLMDMSSSNLKYKQTVSSLGDSLGAEMKKISKDFRIGFGSFVDKPIHQFHHKRVKSSTDGFKHHMTLTDNTTAFMTRVNYTLTSGNRSGSELSLDDMMRESGCKAIGWRDGSLRILVVSTDAGDGQKKKSEKSNDELCRSVNSGTYAESTDRDNSFIRQITNKLTGSVANIIIASTCGNSRYYNDDKDVIVVPHTGQPTELPNQIMTLINKRYETMTVAMEVKDNASDKVRVKYYSNCNTKQMKETRRCSNIKAGEEVEFKVSVEALTCPLNAKDRKIRLRTDPEGSSTFLINLETICECGCESEQEVNSESCSRVGTHQCGVCNCPSHKSGPLCECDAANDEHLCRNDVSSEVCSGRGNCVCGKCDCSAYSSPKKMISGPYCECDNFSCPLSGGQICGGRGKCSCGKCQCHSGWTGEACECPSDKTCAYQEKMCSDIGNCKCEEGYFGEYCHESLISKCEDQRKCVKCALSRDQGTNVSCPYCEAEISDKVKAEFENQHECVLKDDDGCNIIFVLVYPSYSDIPSPLRVQRTKECPAPVNALLIVGVAFGVALLIGLVLLLLWKVRLTAYDRRECAKFEKDVDQANWQEDVNPMFVSSTTTFTNPTYIASDLDCKS